MTRIVTFGEIMMRLSPPDHQLISQARSFDVVYGGGESNVAVSLAHFGMETAFVTRLPSNPIGKSCRNYLRQFGVETKQIIWGGSRLGIYFLEHGAGHRGSNVVYDRGLSALAEIKPGMVDWDEVFDDASWFHWTGITPAISEGAAAACIEAVEKAKKNGLTVSCDLNYRSKLWKWGKEPGEVMPELLRNTDIAIGNEEDAEKVFSISAPHTEVTSGQLDAEAYRVVCKELTERFPNLETIAITLRGSKSASHNTWGAVMWQAGKLIIGPTYDIIPIVDRVGGGDSFVAGLIYGLNQYATDPTRALEFAVAASALKHSIFGDFNLVGVEDVEKLAGGDRSGRVSR